MTEYSIIIPFYKKLLEFKLVFPLNWRHLKKLDCEVVICMDDPHDERELLDLIKTFDGKFRVIINREPHSWRPPSRAINVGIKNALGQYIIVISPESAFDNLLLYRLISSSNEKSFSIGKLKKAQLEDLAAGNSVETVSCKINNSFGYYGSICIKKSILESVNGYDESLIYWGGDDDNLRARLKLIGYKQNLIDSYIVHFENDSSPKRGERSSDPDYYKQLLNPSSPITNNEGWGDTFQEVVHDWVQGDKNG